MVVPTRQCRVGRVEVAPRYNSLRKPVPAAAVGFVISHAKNGGAFSPRRIYCLVCAACGCLRDVLCDDRQPFRDGLVKKNVRRDCRRMIITERTAPRTFYDPKKPSALPLGTERTESVPGCPSSRTSGAFYYLVFSNRKRKSKNQRNAHKRVTATRRVCRNEIGRNGPTDAVD